MNALAPLQAIGNDGSATAQAFFGIVTKSDSLHFPGLRVLLTSLRIHTPETSVVVLDCGMNLQERRFCERAGATLQPVDLSRYEILRAEDQGKYTTAIYALLEADLAGWPVTLHLDADTVVLGNIDEIAEAAARSGVAGIPDYPPLNIDHQIGSEAILEDIREVIPNLDLSATAFNAGVVAFRTAYFVESMRPTIRRLHRLHTQLWGNDQALLNLAAFHANPSHPFEALPPCYNARPKYRRAPNLPAPTKIETPTGPSLISMGATVRILHFVGHPKPWMPGYPGDCPAAEVWRHYSGLADELSCA